MNCNIQIIFFSTCFAFFGSAFAEEPIKKTTPDDAPQWHCIHNPIEEIFKSVCDIQIGDGQQKIAKCYSPRGLHKKVAGFTVTLNRDWKILKQREGRCSNSSELPSVLVIRGQ